MNNCENIDCEFCITHDEDRVEYCRLYDTDCYNVPKCNKYEQLKDSKKNRIFKDNKTYARSRKIY